jgi:hypothetical protein
MATSPNVTLDDVRFALGDQDPRTTNAGAIRGKLGRGGNGTIQKHLDTLREALKPAPVIAAGAAPAAPADAVAAVWSAAYQAAQVLTLGRLEAVTAERERLTATVGQLGQDLTAALAEVDALTDAATTADIDAAQQVKDLAKAQSDAAAAMAALERCKADAAHAAELSTRDAQIVAQSTQSTINRLTDQVSELKSLLHGRTSPPAA